MTDLSFIVTDDAAGERLDKWLATQPDAPSRSQIQQLLGQGHLYCNGQALATASRKVKAGECYHLHLPETVALELEPVAMALDIRFEDEHLLVINKPAGLVVHPGAGTKEPTLVHGLLAHCKDSLSGIGGVARPGIVHRLDKETSGLMLVAKHDKAHQHLSRQLKNRSLSRRYLAFVWGTPNPPYGTIDAAMARHHRQRQRMAVVNGGKPARTHYETLTRYVLSTGGTKARLMSLAALVSCQLESGRTHQIRVHLNHIGHGLIGDPLYGVSTDHRLQGWRNVLPEETMQCLNGFNRQALHACEIRFIHPENKQEMNFECDPPDDFASLEAHLSDLLKSK